ncbi:MAG: sensor histidine kinase [Synergistaceae bacterium]|nr:sensor histidine kinase [Synergistaceae bacterium]
MSSPDKIRSLLKEHTYLTESDIDKIISLSSKIQSMADEGNKDVFIDCPCKDPHEAVVVAEANCKDTIYELSMIGYIIRDDDEPAVFRTFRLGTETQNVRAVSYVTTNGNVLVQNVTPIKNAKKTIGSLIVENRLEKTLDADGQISRANSPIVDKTNIFPQSINLDLISECIDDALVIIGGGGSVVFRNSEACKLYEDFGFIRDIIGCQYEQISLHGTIMVNQANKFHSQELSMGGKYYRVKQYYFHDEEEFILVIIKNITQIKQTEETLVSKSTAIQEAHHRIKNNLQMIHSLLDMQRRRLTSGEGKSALEDGMNRILSISATHEILLKTGGDTVSLINVINKIRHNFLTFIEDSLYNIIITVSGDDFEVDTDISASISLVINELLQNSFKYAFVGRKNGKIDIHVKEVSVYSKITVSDNGNGFIFNAKRDASSLGFQIVQNIVKNKLKGRMDVKSDENGTMVTFDFKTLKHSE